MKWVSKQTFSLTSNLSLKMLGPSLGLLLFPLAISCIHVIESPVTCASNNTACDVHGDSLINSFSGIHTIAECRQICYDVEDCTFITYYSGNGFPLRNFCQIFKSCDETVSCTECISEAKGCHDLCSKNKIGAIDDNFLDLIPNIRSEVDCRKLCIEKSSCEYYTFYLDANPNYGTCVLLSSLLPPIQDCPTCVTGPRQCEDCSFLYEGKNLTQMMFTEPGINISLSTNGLSSIFSECQLRVLAVGGGGYGSHGGGGSGYIHYYTQTLSDSPTQISLRVGDCDEASTININTGNTLVAAAGQRDGGAGYSGGGGNGACEGGSDGGAGECGNGGSGTGEDVTSYILQNYQLSPGAGAQYHYSGGYYWGGGGGGVLVNGAGPGVEERNNKERAQWSDGQGYGGGGTIYSGASGVIIVEIIGGVLVNGAGPGVEEKN